MLKDVENSGNGNLIKREVQKILNIKSRSRHAAGVERKKKSSTNNNRGNWNHLKNTQTISERHTGKARNQGITERNSHIGHCTYTSESTNVKVQNI